MFCNKCGNYFDETTESRFCSKCGNDLSAMRQEASSPIQETPVSDVVTSSTVIKEEPVLNKRVLTKEEYEKNSSKLKLTIILSTIGWIVLCWILIIFLVIVPTVKLVINLAENSGEIGNFFEENFDDEDDDDYGFGSSWDYGSEDEDIPTSSAEKYELTKRVGSSTYGYVSIPSNWIINPSTIDGAEDMVQYASIEGNEIYLLSMYGVDADIKVYADAMVEALDGMVEGINLSKCKVGKFTDCYKIVGYMPDEKHYVYCWFIADDNGYAHYIGLEGTKDNSELFESIIETFSLEK